MLSQAESMTKSKDWLGNYDRQYTQMATDLNQEVAQGQLQ